MSFPGSPPEAAWHLNTNGQRQWWDGSAWGPLATGEFPRHATYPRPVVTLPAKTRTAAYWLAILLGGFGAHRFYLQEFGTAWLILTGSVVQALYRIDGHPASIVIANVILAIIWLWIIVDLFRIPGMVVDMNQRLPPRLSRY